MVRIRSLLIGRAVMVELVKVTFTCTGGRRYRVTADREASSRVAMDPAPGYDPLHPTGLRALRSGTSPGLVRQSARLG